MGLKFPHKAVVLLVLESDGACTSLIGHCARKSTVLILVWCYKARGDREQDLWRYWLPESRMKKRYEKPSAVGCSSKKCELWEQWSSGVAVSRTLTKHCDIQGENTIFKTLSLSPLTTIHIDLADSSVLPLLFLTSLIILSGSPIINTHSCHQDRKLFWVGLSTQWNIIHILGFIIAYFLPTCVMIVAALAIFQAWIWLAVGIGKWLTYIQIRHSHFIWILVWMYCQKVEL
jgi:hypothetical protein